MGYDRRERGPETRPKRCLLAGNLEEKWSDRRSLDAPSYVAKLKGSNTSGIPWEACVKLANTAEKVRPLDAHCVLPNRWRARSPRGICADAQDGCACARARVRGRVKVVRTRLALRAQPARGRAGEG